MTRSFLSIILACFVASIVLVLGLYELTKFAEAGANAPQMEHFCGYLTGIAQGTVKFTPQSDTVGVQIAVLYFGDPDTTKKVGTERVTFGIHLDQIKPNRYYRFHLKKYPKDAVSFARGIDTVTSCNDK
jgi:hypothetical protein